MISTTNYSTRIKALRDALQSSDHIIIGAGSGLSTAAGLDYGGDDFHREFAPWIERYGFKDLYTSSFYTFDTEEEYWAYWAKHIWFCRYRTGATQLYQDLYRFFPEAFVVTTNVDAQFEMAGFPKTNIFATQGDYSKFQPASGTPKTLTDNRDWVFGVMPYIKECRIPTEMIPYMPDGSAVAVNLRVDDSFVEDFYWHQQARRYTDFVHQVSQGRLLLLEFGIGYNTPSIIRIPFEQMAQRFPQTTLVRFNLNNPEPYIENLPRFIAFTEDIGQTLKELFAV